MLAGSFIWGNAMKSERHIRRFRGMVVGLAMLVAAAGCSLLVGIGNIPVPIDGSSDVTTLDGTADGGADVTPSTCDGGKSCDAGALGVCQMAAISCGSGQPVCTVSAAVNGTPCSLGECVSGSCEACSDASVTRNAWNPYAMTLTPRNSAALAFDYGATTPRILIGPGRTPNTGSGPADQTSTWSWSPITKSWTPLGDGGTGLALVGYGLASDGKNMILFGGTDGLGNRSAATWCWNDASAAWLNACGGDAGVACSTGPTKRYGMMMTYDVDDDMILVAGGADAIPLPDAWVWKSSGAACDGSSQVGSWTGVTAMNGAGQDGTMVYDPVHKQFVAYGFLIYPSSPANVTHLYDPLADSWTDLATGPTPTRYTPYMAWDPVIQRVVLFGGYSDNSNRCPIRDNVVDSVCQDQWEWDGACWTLVNAATYPLWISAGAGMAWDGKSLVLTGGQVDYMPNTAQAVTNTYTSSP
jgi:hypothetical protein